MAEKKKWEEDEREGGRRMREKEGEDERGEEKRENNDGRWTSQYHSCML